MSTALIESALHRILTHPVALVAKRPLKDALWWVRGRRLVNPPVHRAESILFVCLGNICRSPFAAVRFEHLLQARGMTGIRCASAGIQTTQANRSPEDACQAASAFGVDLRIHVPTQLTAGLIDEYDLIVVMEASQVLALQRQYPSATERIWLLSLLDPGCRGYDRYNIADPFGQSFRHFQACYSRIERSLDGLLNTLIAPLSHRVPSATSHITN